MQEKYINPFTDFGFKKIFGEEANKDLLMDFLNELLPDRGRITDLTFLKNEQLGVSPVDRKAVFDLYCQTDTGERFIVEIQKARQKYFKDRSIYYATFPIQEQAQTGDWDFRQTGVYTVAVMDFIFDEDPAEKDKLRHDIQLMDIETHRIFFPKLRFIYLEMPKFN
ncbi:Rpn family recombination-promoting nuclease/putative transposase [uncultured Fibrella sp.]|uniref:Rpn family recombination-promoting nuclease/putative transposase n=1 Tax=uncultured Fibrella sp. TaxID=1284596 RepID=UPI0035C94FCB